MVLVYGGLLFLFRQNRLTYKDDVAFKNDVLYSPVSGVLKSVRANVEHPFFGKNLSEVRIIVRPWQEYGVYLPFTSEVVELKAQRGKKFLRFQEGSIDFSTEEKDIGLDLMLTGVNGSTIGMKFVPCWFGGWPEIALLPGDRGKRRTNIGYFPFGGSLILYLPAEIHLLLETGDELIAGVSVFAGLTKEKDHERKV